jgi:predicted RNase H-like nuclease
MLAYELAIYVSVRCDVPESVVEARVSEAERSAIINEELARRSITDPRDRRARSRDVFDAAAHRVEAFLSARAAAIPVPVGLPFS